MLSIVPVCHPTILRTVRTKATRALDKFNQIPRFLALIVLACLKLWTIHLLQLFLQGFDALAWSLLVNETNHRELCFPMHHTFCHFKKRNALLRRSLVSTISNPSKQQLLTRTFFIRTSLVDKIGNFCPSVFVFFVLLYHYAVALVDLVQSTCETDQILHQIMGS